MEVVERPSLAQIFRRFYSRYRQDQAVTREQRTAAWCIQACRTPALGGRQYQCRKCGQEHTVYHSCRNRHCPICQLGESYRWLEAQEGRLLPVSYFHVVFTLASELHPVFRYNRKALYGLLLSTAASVLHRFGADPQWLGARMGFVGLLHLSADRQAPGASRWCFIRTRTSSCRKAGLMKRAGGCGPSGSWRGNFSFRWWR